MAPQTLPPRFKYLKQHSAGKLHVSITNYGQYGTDAHIGTVYPETAALHYISKGGLFFRGIIPAEGTGRNQPGEMERSYIYND
ncbi:hypothetical protein ACFL6I_04365 [candidate division KSB1 bacterium]